MGNTHRTLTGGKVVVAGNPEATAKLASDVEKSSMAHQPSVWSSRLPEHDLTLASTGGTEKYGQEFMASLAKLSKGKVSYGADPSSPYADPIRPLP